MSTEPIDPLLITKEVVTFIRAGFEDRDSFYTSRCCNRLYFGVDAPSKCRTCPSIPNSMLVAKTTTDDEVLEFLTK